MFKIYSFLSINYYSKIYIHSQKISRIKRIKNNFLTVFFHANYTFRPFSCNDAFKNISLFIISSVKLEGQYNLYIRSKHMQQYPANNRGREVGKYEKSR